MVRWTLAFYFPRRSFVVLAQREQRVLAGLVTGASVKKFRRVSLCEFFGLCLLS